MLGIGSKLPSFEINGEKPGFHARTENGRSMPLRALGLRPKMQCQSSNMAAPTYPAESQV